VSRSLGALILLVVLAVLGGAVYLTEIRPQQEAAAVVSTPTPSPRDIFTLSGQTFDRLAVSGQGQRWVAEKEGDNWLIVEPRREPGDSTQINSAFFSFETLRAFRLVSEDDPDLAKYGLDNPPLTVEFRTAEGQNYGLAFGNENVDKSYRFAKRLDSPAIYLVMADTYRRFEGMLTRPPYQPTPTPVPSPQSAGG
jgi:hypothetical protein